MTGIHVPAAAGFGKRGDVHGIGSAAVLAAGLAWSVAAADQTVEAGLLSCHVSDPVEAEGGDTGQVRRLLCDFKPKNGAEETYTGKVQVAARSPEEKRTLLWMVKMTSAQPWPPGFLQQSYAADPKTPAGQIPDLIGQVNAGIVLQSMTERKEGSASAGEKSPAAAFAVLGAELNLKSTTG
ncbi:MAG: DUF992 domain-containing protein [Hyphomicrobiaceae bacterium]|nr:DUF992 domain-containing protein [Hyphomicrobiaceae bacterium]